MNEPVVILCGILRQYSFEAGLSSINKMCKGKPVVTLHSKADCCNGSKTDFDSVSRGSSPLSVVFTIVSPIS